MKYRDREDNIITILAVIAGIVLFILWLFRDSQELFDGGVEVYGYAVNLVVGVVVSFIFFYLNVLIPKKKTLRHTLIYVGECIGTICFNEISKVRVFESGVKNLKIMNIMGVKIQIRDITPNNQMSIQEDINKENIYILNNLLDVLDKNAFEQRKNVIELINSLFPEISENYKMLQCFIDAEKKRSNFVGTLSCKRYSGRSNIGVVTKTAISRLNYLLENESKMHSINTAIQYGE